MTPDPDTRLNAQELARQLAEKRVSVIDVREAMEFAGGHIEGSVNVPWYWYATAVAAVPRPISMAASPPGSRLDCRCTGSTTPPCR
jgi:3-mercaptopyruvate sulfurtransferase SseA